MNEFKKVAIFTKEHIALIGILLNTIGFLNYYLYYKSFDIEIFTYIGLTDILFYTLEYILKIILIILIYEFLVMVIFTFLCEIFKYMKILYRRKTIFYFSRKKKDKERIQDIFYKNYNDNLTSFKFLMLLAGIFVLAAFPFKMTTIPAYFFYMIYLIEISAKERMYKISVSLLVFILFFSTSFNTLIISYNKRFFKDNTEVSFVENGEKISTNGHMYCYNYLGETSAYIFLYDIDTKTARIASKNNISDIQVKNGNKIDYFITKLKKQNIVIKILNAYK